MTNVQTFEGLLNSKLAAQLEDELELIEPGDEISAAADGLRLTDAGNAKRFVLLHGQHIRYVRQWGKWLVYRKGKWTEDPNDVLVTQLAKDVAKKMFKTLAGLDTEPRKLLFAAANAAERRSGLAGMVALARDLPGVLIEHEDLDADPFVLNTINGTVNLSNGQLTYWSQEDLCSKQCPVIYDPSIGISPLWIKCLERWQPDPEMRDYLQLEAGAYLCGIPTETLSIHYGHGGNGKSRYFGALQYVLGDYAVVPHRSLVLQSKFEQHDTVRASLFHTRLAVLSETGTQSQLNAENVKNITGGDRQSCHHMREDEWSFMPTHTLVMFCNHKPIIHDTSDGIWRRVRLISWDVTIPDAEQDTRLAEKLTNEATGILNWAVEGAIKFIANGCKIPMPNKVAVDTQEYRNRENVSGRFIADCLEIGRSKDHRVPTSSMKLALTNYCVDNGLDEPKWSEVTEALALAGGKTTTSNGIRLWEGFRLTSGPLTIQQIAGATL
jgi:putative DNA primase/helicase